MELRRRGVVVEVPGLRRRRVVGVAAAEWRRGVVEVAAAEWRRDAGAVVAAELRRDVVEVVVVVELRRRDAAGEAVVPRPQRAVAVVAAGERPWGEAVVAALRHGEAGAAAGRAQDGTVSPPRRPHLRRPPGAGRR